MNLLYERLCRVLDDHGLTRGAIVADSGEVLAQGGDLAYRGGGLVSAYLGPAGDPKASFDLLDGVELPQFHQSGENFAILDKPSPDLMAIVFFDANIDLDEFVDLAKDVSRSLALAFGKDDG
jgi:hypothetical protein